MTDERSSRKKSHVPLTLEDIAKLSGVSRSTVSRVINHDPNVKEETRMKVQEVIDHIDFQPNLAAKGLVSGKTNIIGVLIPTSVMKIFSDPYFPRLLQGISSACNALGYSVMLWLSEPEYERRMVSRILHNGLIEGVIIASVPTNDTIVNSLIDSNKPFFMVGRHPVLDVSCLDVDNIQAVRNAVLHLAHIGYKRIATITGDMNQISGIDRFQGYVNGLKDAKLLFNRLLVAEGDFSEEGGYKCMQRLIKQKPEAVFIASDMMAYGAMRAIREANLRIPEDIAIVGFDDLSSSANTTPPLTTVRQPIPKMGMLAAEALIEMIESGSSEKRRVVVDTELVVRQSCGAYLKGAVLN